MKYFIEALKKYTVFKGRASRKEFWYFLLFYVILGIALLIATFIPFINEPSNNNLFSLIILPIMMIYISIFFFPLLTVTTRRLHDINLSGWWFFLNFIAWIGPIILLVLLALPSAKKENKYGPSPKGIEVK